MSEQKPQTTEGKGLLSSPSFSPPNKLVQADYEKALGRLTIRFSWLHYFLETFGWKVWGLNPTSGSILTKDLQTKHLVIKLRDSSKYAIPRDHDRKRFISILNRIEKAAEKRNDLLHSLWIFHGPSVGRFNKKSPNLESFTTLQDIEQLNRSLMEISIDLAEFKDSGPVKAPLVAALEDYIRSKDK